jgi:hypothetical protein
MSPSVPYDRFQEVNTKAKETAAQLEQLKAQTERLEKERNQAVEAAKLLWARSQGQQQVVQQMAPAQPPPQPTSTLPDDPNWAVLRSQLGPGEEGDKALAVLNQHAEWYARKMGYVSQDEVRQIVNEALAGHSGQINTTFAVTNRFQRWVDQGMLDQDQAMKMNQQLASVLKEYPEVAKDPTRVDYIMSQMFVKAIEEGSVRPTFQPRSRNPLVVGGGPSGTTTEPEPMPDITSSPFTRIRSIDKDRVRELVERSIHAHNGATH